MIRPAIHEEDFYITERRHSLDNVLVPGETVLGFADISIGIYTKGIAMATLAVIALFYGLGLGVFFGFIAILLLALEYVTRKYLLVAVTDQRVVLGGGIMAQEVVFLSYSKIEAVETVRTPLGYILGYATLLLTGTGRMRVAVPYVENAIEVAEAISSRMLAKDRAQERV